MSHGVTPNVILRFGEFQLSQDIGSTCVHLSRQGSNHDLVLTVAKELIRLISQTGQSIKEIEHLNLAHLVDFKGCTFL